jgi:hypothetical protein
MSSAPEVPKSELSYRMAMDAGFTTSCRNELTPTLICMEGFMHVIVPWVIASSAW